MPSLFWNLPFEDSPDFQYEYPAQEQFVREAEKLLGLFGEELEKYNLKFHRNDESSKKAIWLLQNDALDSTLTCLHSLKTKNHRIAGKQFRDVIETLDLAAYFHSNTEISNRDLMKWYQDEIILHSRYRNYISKTEGEEKKKKITNQYRSISKFTHRTYLILLYGYILGRDNLLVYDSHREDKLLVPTTTISIYFAILAYTIQFLSDELSARELISKTRTKKIWKDSLEKKTIPKRSMSPKEVFNKAKKDGKI